MHSEYSVSDGIVRIDDAVRRAAADHMPALALTDAANLFGMVKFYGAARGAGVKPIIGADCWIENEADREKPFRALLLCTSRTGYLGLCALLSRAWLTNQHRGRAIVAQGWLDEGTDGLIALSGFLGGELAAPLLADHAESAERIAQRWAGLFPGRYYIELQRAGLPNGEALLLRSVALAGRLQLPVVATHPVQFLARDDFKAHEARVCIAQGYLLGDQRRPKLFTTEQYFKSQQEMAELFADAPQALENSIEIARRCNLEIALGKNRLPDFPTPKGVTLEDHLKNEAQTGLARRAAELGLERDALERYRARLDFEIRTIVQMGFAGYFLIVADFINWAKTNDVPRRAGAWLRRRIARGLLARHHRPGSAALRPPFRALPESRAHLDAGLRHRLLPGRPRSRDRLCATQVRRAERFADRHVRTMAARAWCATSAGCSTWATTSATRSPS